jgi:DNA-binding transcriptional ArsR family regulator
MRRDVFQAIADPTRREILGLIARASLNINAVSENFDVSRAAVYKHLKILRQCGLVEITQQGRERFCRAKPEKLSEVTEWVEQYRRIWEARLDSLESYLEQVRVKEKAQTQIQKQAKPKGR